MIDVCLLGTGGMMPLPKRRLTSLYVRLDGRALLIDCGEGTQTAIREASLRFKCIEGICITHFHADHVSGLPGLLLTLGNEGRTEPLHMYGPEGLEAVVTALRAIVPELPFEIIFHELPMENSHFACAGLSVDAFALDHGMPCLGFRLRLERKRKFDPDSARAKGVPVKYWGRLQNGESVGGFTPEDVLGQARRGLRLVYATDTRPVPGIVRHAQGADLLVLEGMYGDPEKQERAQEAHHMMMQEAAAIARDAKARALWLTHFSPATPEPELFEAQLRGIFENTFIGTDGRMETLRFGEE